MSNFNFGSALANTNGVASDKRLKPYTINKVKFIEAKLDIIHSEKNSQDYDVLKVRWDGEQGFYEENLFLPSTSGQDVERQPNQWGGEQPSAADRTMMFFAHCLGVINKEGFEKLKKVVGNAKNFKDVATMVAKLLNEKKNCDCYLKLAGRNSNGVVYASLPFYTAISKDGEPYVSNNFLSLKDDLAFTPSEDKKRTEVANAKPTPAPVSMLDAATDNSDLDSAAQDDLTDLLDSL